MDEARWLTYKTPLRMLRFAKRRASERKLRLLECACCRMLDPALCLSEVARTAVEVTERYVDGAASREELEAVSESARQSCQSNPAYLHWASGGLRPTSSVEEMRLWVLLMKARAASATNRDDGEWDAQFASDFPSWQLKGTAGKQIAAALLRDLFGPLLFRAVSIDPGWLAWGEGRVPRLAQAIYEERCWEDLPVLADALEDAGCDNQDILSHLRGPGAHVRGCWVVDAILGKE